MGKLFWMLFLVVVPTVAGIFFTVLLAADMANMSNTPIVLAVGGVLGVVVTYIVAKMVNDQRRKSA